MDKEIKKDKCVSCWEDSEYDIDTPLNLRKNYIETVGQLCDKCFNKIYNIEENHNVIESFDFLIKK